MTVADYSLLDNPETSARSFHPLRGWTDTPPGAVDYGVTMADGTVLSCRFFAVGRANPTVLFFYGGGENVARYDEIAPHYNGIGANFFVADYRGFGASSGSPSFNAVLSDAHAVLDWLQETMRALRFTGPVYVMGRSMGRHCGRRACGCRGRQDQRRHYRERAGQPGKDRPGIGAGGRSGAGGRLPVQALFDAGSRSGDPRPMGRIGAATRSGGHVQQVADDAQAPGDHSRGRTQRPHVRGFPAVFHRHPGLHGPICRPETGDRDHWRNCRIGPAHNHLLAAVRIPTAQNCFRHSRKNRTGRRISPADPADPVSVVADTQRQRAGRPSPICHCEERSDVAIPLT